MFGANMVKLVHTAVTKEFVEHEISIIESAIDQGLVEETEEVLAFKQYLYSFDTSLHLSEFHPPDRPYDPYAPYNI